MVAQVRYQVLNRSGLRVRMRIRSKVAPFDVRFRFVVELRHPIRQMTPLPARGFRKIVVRNALSMPDQHARFCARECPVVVSN